jgi:hypothetical protein
MTNQFICDNCEQVIGTPSFSLRLYDANKREQVLDWDLCAPCSIKVEACLREMRGDFK